MFLSFYRKQQSRAQQQQAELSPNPSIQESSLMYPAPSELRGELMSVCGDCKDMVLHNLLSLGGHRTPSPPLTPPPSVPQRQSLHLNLTPVYSAN